MAKKGIEQTPFVTYVKKYKKRIPNYKIGNKIHMQNLFQRV